MQGLVTPILRDGSCSMDERLRAELTCLSFSEAFTFQTVVSRWAFDEDECVCCANVGASLYWSEMA